MADTGLLSFQSSFSGIWQLILIGFLTILLWKLIYAVIKFRKYRKHFNSMPGETDFHWLYGNLHKVSSDPLSERTMNYWDEMGEKYPKFSRIWNGPFEAYICCTHSQTVQKILKTSEPKPRTISSVYTMGLDWLGEGLLISNGPKWSRNRRLLTPAFHFDILQPYITVKNEATDILLEKIDNCVKLNKSFELFEYFSLCTLDILLRCAFSYRDDIQGQGDKHPYIKAIIELTDGWVERAVNPFCYPNVVFYLTSQGRRFAKNCKYVHTFSDKIITLRKRELEVAKPSGEKKRKYLDFLDILLMARDENNEGLSADDIRNETDTFLFEGHDTTTSALSWLIYSLATNQEHQKKVQEEVDGILAGKDSDYITLNDFPKMEYLGLCIKESLRLYTTVPFIQRRITKDTDIDGYTIPSGTTFMIQLHNLHHNSTLWEKPNEFHPERFSPDNTKGRDTFAFTPFSAGPRNCIGQNFAMHEIRILIARMLHRYTFEVDPAVPVQKKPSVILRTENGIHVFAKPRK